MALAARGPRSARSCGSRPGSGIPCGPIAARTVTLEAQAFVGAITDRRTDPATAPRTLRCPGRRPRPLRPSCSWVTAGSWAARSRPCSGGRRLARDRARGPVARHARGGSSLPRLRLVRHRPGADDRHCNTRPASCRWGDLRLADVPQRKDVLVGYASRSPRAMRGAAAVRPRTCSSTHSLIASVRLRAPLRTSCGGGTSRTCTPPARSRTRWLAWPFSPRSKRIEILAERLRGPLRRGAL